MSKPAMPQRLEHVLQLPVGTHLNDASGLEFVFVGTRVNPVGAEFLFERVNSRSTKPLSLSLLDGALLKFPSLASYITKSATQ